MIVKNNARKFFESFLPHLLHLLQMSTKAPPSLYLSSSPSSNYYPLYPLEALVLPCCYKVLQSLFCYIKTLLESPVHRHFCCCSMEQEGISPHFFFSSHIYFFHCMAASSIGVLIVLASNGMVPTSLL